MCNPLHKYFLLALILPVCSQAATAESTYAAAWGPSVGSEQPLLQASDQTGSLQSFETLTGSNGLLFVFNRSVDW